LFADTIESKDGPAAAGIAVVLSYYSIPDRKTSIIGINSNRSTPISPEGGISIQAKEVTALVEKAGKQAMEDTAMFCLDFFKRHITDQLSRVLFIILFYFIINNQSYSIIINSIFCVKYLNGYL
jgi:hypothetical protein